MFLRLVLAASFVLVGASAASAAKLTSPSKHRKVTKGIGNCVFSKAPLGFKKDASYKLSTDFKVAGDIHVRCYLPKILKDFMKIGKLKSSLRGMQRNGVGPPKQYFLTRLQFEEPIRNFESLMTYSSSIEHRDQVRLDMPVSGSPPDCDFDMGKFNKPKECANVNDEVKYIAQAKKSKLPFKSKVCVYVEFQYVDQKVRNKKLELVDRMMNQVMAKGCFNYTATK